MARNKLYKYSTITKSEFIFENIQGNILDLKNQWSQIFNNTNPIVLEIACGYGEYTIGLAKNNPNCNYIGLDIKGDRLFQGLQEIQKYNLNNVRFIRSKAEDIASLFAANELSGIWITHPDPQPKKEKKRLIYKRFLDIYKIILKPQGDLFLRTDNTNFFEYSLQTLGIDPAWQIQYFSWDYYSSPWFKENQNFITRYEKQFSNSNIKLIHLLHQKSL